MLNQTDVERERYESRRKAQLDHNSWLNAARIEGKEMGEKIGLERGEKIGAIHVCERLLNRPETPTSHLASMPLDELNRLAMELQEQFAKKG